MTPFKSLLTVASLAFTATVSFAAPVSFTTSVIPAADTTYSWLDNSGTLLTAVNFGVVRNAPYTYNAPTAASNPNPNVTLNGITFTNPAPAVNNPSGAYFSTAGAGGGTLTIGYDTGRFSNVSQNNQPLYGLVYDIIRSNANNQRLTLTLNTLTVGQEYQVQFIFSALNTADNPTGADRNVGIAAGLWQQTTNEQNGTGSDGTFALSLYGPTTGARIVTATFTADSATQAFSFFSGTTGGNSRVGLAGFTLAAVPEPSTYGIAFAALLGALVFVRRRRLAATAN